MLCAMDFIRSFYVEIIQETSGSFKHQCVMSRSFKGQDLILIRLKSYGLMIRSIKFKGQISCQDCFSFE